MSRLASSLEVGVCRPTKIAPSMRTSVGQASGRTVASVTARPPAAWACSGARASVAVALGTISLSATQSHSPARPSNGRRTSVAEARPWHAL